MRFKDAMRDHSVGDVAEAWMQLVATYSGSRPELTATVLEVVRRYVNWIDIGLVANDRWATRASSTFYLVQGSFSQWQDCFHCKCQRCALVRCKAL